MKTIKTLIRLFTSRRSVKIFRKKKKFYAPFQPTNPRCMFYIRKKIIIMNSIYNENKTLARVGIYFANKNNAHPSVYPFWKGEWRAFCFYLNSEFDHFIISRLLSIFINHINEKKKQKVKTKDFFFPPYFHFFFLFLVCFIWLNTFFFLCIPFYTSATAFNKFLFSFNFAKRLQSSLN